MKVFPPVLYSDRLILIQVITDTTNQIHAFNNLWSAFEFYKSFKVDDLI